MTFSTLFPLSGQGGNGLQVRVAVVDNHSLRIASSMNCRMNFHGVSQETSFCPELRLRKFLVLIAG